MTLDRTKALPPSPYRKGGSETLLWTLALGPCPVEPAAAAFTERMVRRLIDALGEQALSNRDAARLRGIAVAAAWLLGSAAQSPRETESGTTDPSHSLPNADEAHYAQD